MVFVLRGEGLGNFVGQVRPTKLVKSEFDLMEKSNLVGAMYSSVPTNEFDCVDGSATNVGGG